MDFSQKFDARERGAFPSEELLREVLTEFSIHRVSSCTVLSGGFSNLNYLIDYGTHNRCVLRLSSNPLEQLQGELSVLELVKDSLPVPAVYAVAYHHPLLKRHAVCMSCLPGVTLDTVEDDLDDRMLSALGEELGEALAIMHGFQFSNSGFFGSDQSFRHSFDDFYQGYYEHLQESLENPFLKKRLANIELRALSALVEAEAPRIEKLRHERSLVHSDFNQKNILVHRNAQGWTLSGILDWEFSFSGAGLVDFGNFFRYEGELSEAYKDPLCAAYQAQGASLDEDWQRTARVLDLLSMVHMLTRAQESPRTFNTARGVIQKTLQQKY